MTDNTKTSDFNSNGCPLKHTVVAAPRGTSMSGFGCLYTGGHCLPCDDCTNRASAYQQREEEEQKWEELRQQEQDQYYIDNPHEG